ncbi:MAG: peptidoglycan-binding protein, partial [Pseudolabrys sp.]|nr:peptidoglycan-binding protein [Pseudolabrys sp.]
MADWTRVAIGGLALAFALSAPAALRAENAPPAAQSADPVYEGQKAAFEALPEADRKAIQEAMIWSGQYNGVIDGVFGKRTRDAIVAYQTSVKAKADGMVDAAQAAAMAAATQKAKAAVRFQVFTDEKTGIKIGAPLKILDKRIDAGDVRLAKADGSVTLDLMSAGADAKLGAMFSALTAEKESRKITLKLSKQDYFVVSGEEGGRKFYQRTAKAPTGAPDPTLIRGFRFTYPVDKSAELDKISVAIADSFEPFPMAAASASATQVATK